MNDEKVKRLRDRCLECDNQLTPQDGFRCAKCQARHESLCKAYLPACWGFGVVQCNRKPLVDSDYCWQHKKKRDAAPAANATEKPANNGES